MVLPAAQNNFDRESEQKAFDDSKAGVKGLSDAGVAKLPRIFIHHNLNLHAESGYTNSRFSFPIIDLNGIEDGEFTRAQIVDEVRNACEKWGFFQVINHRVSVNVLDEMIEGVRRFHEQDTEVKKEFYSRDLTRKVLYFSGFELYKSAASDWKDTLACFMTPNPPSLEDLPLVCRDITMEYSKQIMQLGLTLLELLSEALGFESNHLQGIGCAKGLHIRGHYYPACPEPELTMGTSQHSDRNFLTILLQDEIGGLQVLHEDQWVDVTPSPEALIINVGDLLKVISNEKFQSVNHRVLAKNTGPRISVASFFRTQN